MRNKNFVRKKQAIYISPNKKSTRIIKTLMDFSFFIKIKIKMVCFSVPSMFPIYGMGAILPEISGLVDWWLGGERLDWMDRVIRHGILYTVLIFMGEYLFGSILKAYGICPWDYTGLHSNVNGLIRLDFAPLWFATGLIFERITKKKEG